MKLAKKVKFQWVTLRPGEALYVPPYWFLRTEIVSAEHSPEPRPAALPLREHAILHHLHAALEVESASLEQLVLLEAMHTPFPRFLAGKPNEKLSPMERMVCGQVYLMHVLARVPGAGSPRRFMRALVAQRYTENTVLRLRDSLFVTRLQGALSCMQAHPAEHEQLLSRCALASMCGACCL